MSFAYTEHEQKRVVLASLFGVHLDHIGYADMAVIIVWAVVFGVQLLAVLFTLKNHRYRPIHNQQPLLMALVYFTSVIWFVGDIATNNVIHLPTHLLQNCIFIVIWLRSSLGQTMALTLLLYRCIRLYFKYRLRRHFTPLVSAVFGSLLLATNIVPPIIMTILPTDQTVNYVPGLEICNFNPRFKDVVTVLTWLVFASLALACAVLFLSTKCTHNEHHQILVAWLGMAMANAFNTAVFYIKPRYPVSVAWRLCVVSMNQLSVLGA
ncbi:hypothetical protein IWW50_004422, partial [Coemansia erecta]